MFRHYTVPVSSVALLYVKGEFQRILDPGRHRVPWGAEVMPVDLREELLTVAAQDILTADGLGVRVSAVVRVGVEDARRLHETAQDPQGTVYLATQVVLRERLSALTVDELTQRGARLPVAELTAAVDEVARTVGLTAREVVVKDVILPPELRHAAVELAAAKARGMAQLETARAETAALRSLANAAKVLEDHPALARLRMVQEARPGTQLVVQLGEQEQNPRG